MAEQDITTEDVLMNFLFEGLYSDEYIDIELVMYDVTQGHRDLQNHTVIQALNALENVQFADPEVQANIQQSVDLLQSFETQGDELATALGDLLWWQYFRDEEAITFEDIAMALSMVRILIRLSRDCLNSHRMVFYAQGILSLFEDFGVNRWIQRNGGWKNLPNVCPNIQYQTPPNNPYVEQAYKLVPPSTPPQRPSSPSYPPTNPNLFSPEKASSAKSHFSACAPSWIKQKKSQVGQTPFGVWPKRPQVGASATCSKQSQGASTSSSDSAGWLSGMKSVRRRLDFDTSPSPSPSPPKKPHSSSGYDPAMMDYFAQLEIDPDHATSSPVSQHGSTPPTGQENSGSSFFPMDPQFLPPESSAIAIPRAGRQRHPAASAPSYSPLGHLSLSPIPSPPSTSPRLRPRSPSPPPRQSPAVPSLPTRPTPTRTPSAPNRTLVTLPNSSIKFNDSSPKSPKQPSQYLRSSSCSPPLSSSLPNENLPTSFLPVEARGRSPSPVSTNRSTSCPPFQPHSPMRPMTQPPRSPSSPGQSPPTSRGLPLSLGRPPLCSPARSYSPARSARDSPIMPSIGSATRSNQRFQMSSQPNATSSSPPRSPVKSNYPGSSVQGSPTRSVPCFQTGSESTSPTLSPRRSLAKSRSPVRPAPGSPSRSHPCFQMSSKPTSPPFSSPCSPAKSNYPGSSVPGSPTRSVPCFSTSLPSSSPASSVPSYQPRSPPSYPTSSLPYSSNKPTSYSSRRGSAPSGEYPYY